MTAVPPGDLRQPHAWFIVCTSRALAPNGPRATVLQGVPLVLFREATGAPTALLDRCPHRNVPLSMGRVRNGHLTCAYHGWTFDQSGACVAVPGLVRGDISLPSRCVSHFPTRELDGFIWVYSTPDCTPTHEPFRFPHLDDPAYSTVIKHYRVRATLHAVIENTLDVPHTGFLHGGLFRTAEKKNVIDVHVRRDARSAEAQFIGEPAPRGLAGRLLAPQGGVVEHVDRFLLPSIAQVDYRLGAKSHLITSTAFTPAEGDTLEVFAVVTFKLPLPHWLVKPFVAPVGARIFAQDAVMLGRQLDHVRRFGGEKYVSSELDVLGPQVTLLLKQSAAGEITTPHEHRVQMKT